MKPRRRRLAAVVLAAALPLTPACSIALSHSNAGIAYLEQASAPVRQVSLAGKYLGWLLGAPVFVGLMPIAALLWATPWIDLPTAVDIASAPALGLGYALESVFGFPTAAAFCWAEHREQSLRPASAPPPLAPPPMQTVPWGMVVEHRPLPAAPRATPPPPADVLRYYAIPPGAPERLAVALDRAQERDPVTVRLEGVAADLELYLASDAGGPRPVVLLTPPTQAVFAAKWMGQRFARRGAHAAVVVPDDEFLDPKLDAEQLEAKLRANVVAARTVVAAMTLRADVSRILYMGVSAGGIFGTLLLAVEPRVERAALVVPGGDLARLVEVSDEATVTEYREAWEERGVTPRQLSDAFARHVRTEPLRLAPYVDPRKVVVFLAAWDTRVPTEGGLALTRALGSPETWLLAGNHESSTLCFGFVLRECEAFLLDDR